MNSIVGVMASVGAYVYLAICQPLFENHGKAAPILGICLIDLGVAILLILCILFKWFGNLPKIEE